MNIKQIQFKNGFSIFLAADQDGKSATGQSELENIVSAKNIRYSFIAGTEERATALPGENFFLDENRILNGDFAYVKDSAQSLRRHLKKGNCLLLFKNKKIIPFVYCITIHPAKPEAPEQLVTLDAKSRTYINKYLTYLEKSRTDEIINHPHLSGGPQKRFFSIRSKLLVITSSIVILSLSVVIFLASFLFRKYNEILIQEYNLSLSRLIGKTVEGKFEDIIKHTSQYAASLQMMNRNANDYFLNNQEIIRAEFYTKNPLKTGQVKPFKTMDNPAFSARYTANGIAGLISKYPDPVNAAFNGQISVLNVSSEINFPSIMVAFPVSPVTVSVLVLSSSDLFEIFQHTRQTELIELLLIGPSGDLIAHSDESRSLQNINYIKMPIVRSMIESASSNGSRKYSYLGTEYLGSYQSIKTGNMGIVTTVPVDRVFEAVYRIQDQNLIIMLMTLTLAVISVYFFSKTISIPIINLVTAASRIEKGDYDIHITSTTRDEIGKLTNSFLSMAHGLKEKEMIKEAFGKFVNPLIAEKALTGEIKLGGDVKHATVLFSDIRGFTQISEVSTPQQIVEMLNRYFTAMVESIHLSNGTVDKFIGDAIMAHWGAVEEGLKDPENAVQAALLMRKSLMELNEEFIIDGIPPLKTGIGINSGPVIAGQIGSETRLEYTVIGDAVNLASRIEYLNKHFGTDILISEETYLLVAHHYKCVKMPEIMVRGKEKPQIVYAVLGANGDPSAPADLAGLRKLLGIEYHPDQAEQEISQSSDKLVKKLNRPTHEI